MEPYFPPAFWAGLLADMPESIRVVVARLGTTAVAAAIFFVGGDVLYGRYWGCDEDYHSLHFETCFYQGIELALAEGCTRFEPGAQGEHKLRRGFRPVPDLVRALARAPGLRAGHRRVAGARAPCPGLPRDGASSTCHFARRSVVIAQGMRWLGTAGQRAVRFPDPASALSWPNGLLAAGGDLSPERLLAAYRLGIFPWYEAGQPILWWCPTRAR
jgi:hypothetical protein